MLTQRLLVSLLLLCSMFFGVSLAGYGDSQVLPPSAQAQADYEPVFENDLCPFRLPENFAVRCGKLLVPENRNDPNSATLELRVAILGSRAETPAEDPIIFLQGGPGMDAIGPAMPLIEQYYYPWLREREIIIIDKRGAGFSGPNLNCPEVELLYYERLGLQLSAEDQDMFSMLAAERCFERISTTTNIDLAGYTINENAQDVRDLRIALGIETWNIYALSSATEIAFAVMRDYPEGVRSVILDGVDPLNAYGGNEGFGVHNFTFRKLFEACESDEVCSETYPNLQSDFLNVVEELNENPILIPVLHPISEESIDYYLNGDILVGEIGSLIGQSGVTQFVPRIIHDIAQGDFRQFAILTSQNLIIPLFFSEGAIFASDCRRPENFSDVITPVLNEGEFDPAITTALQMSTAPSIFPSHLCDVWTTGEDEISFYAEPVSSDIPTLLLTGEFDNVTPPQWGSFAAETLSQGYFFEVPTMGHGTLKKDCPIAMSVEFFNDPSQAPDNSCFAEMHLTFTLPSEE